MGSHRGHHDGHHDGHLHGHLHGKAGFAAGAKVARGLWISIAVWAGLTLIGLIALWPGASGRPGYSVPDTVHGYVERVETGPCSGTTDDDEVTCNILTIVLTSGPDSGQRTTIENFVMETNVRVPGMEDELVLTVTPTETGNLYQFADYQRSTSMVLLAGVFAVAVVALGRWRGHGALAGLVISIVVLLAFVLPALLEGSNPVLVALVGASVIAFASLYLAHGVNSPTNVALLSTLAALTITGLLAWAFVGLCTITGLADENAGYLTALGISIDPRGLLLAGVVLGSLGVLDDVTVTQVSAVGELNRSRPDAHFGELYRSALVIGRDHVSSTVNTLFLAYAGAALPLLLLFTTARQPIATTATSEIVAVEIVRALVGSIGLVASVPISTGLAAALLAPRRSAKSASHE